ncbi:MAG: electron transport complex subunit RsxE [Hyphomicrobiales bacterium]|nr:MAG: electron transport complex subunit RsxE [Hyphomicrobiales bacterium]
MSRKPKTEITWDTFAEGLWRENPVFVMLLGMCPVLAVSNTAMNSLAMGLATTFVLLTSGALISILRNFIPKQVRIATYIVIIATFVTIVDYTIQAISLDLYNALGAFIQLIVVNCIILGRAEAFASKNTLARTVVNATGMGLGFTLALLCIGVVREVLGAGALFGIDLFGPSFEPWVVMILPPGGFIILGMWLLIFEYVRRSRADAAKSEEVKHAA